MDTHISSAGMKYGGMDLQLGFVVSFKIQRVSDLVSQFFYAADYTNTHWAFWIHFFLLHNLRNNKYGD